MIRKEDTAERDPFVAVMIQAAFVKMKDVISSNTALLICCKKKNRTDDDGLE